MTQVLYPVLFTLLVWWASTGLILYLDGMPRRTYRWSMLGATVLAAVALAGLALTRNDATVGGAFVAFSCAIMVWGWVEMSFLMGLVTGPRKSTCPVGVSEWHRLRCAIEAILHHELALMVAAAAVLATTSAGTNPVGAWTFLVLWVMRLSAKLNVFFGVRNLYVEFLPDHLRYLASYFRRKPMNLLFPVSVTASTMMAALIWQQALSPHASAFEVASFAFVGTLLALAILEHWFMVLPLPAGALWGWGLRSRTTPEAEDQPVNRAVAAPPA